MDFTEFELQRIPYSSRTSYLIKAVTFCTLPTLDTNVWGHYNKLAAFIPNAKDV
ncbi:SsrA-binding protein [Helicobacter pylori]|uniref:SsrA-binding protein n=1 Tax=Helicobacter pylori TaxID=210 RepID=A0A7K1NY17_HELPX|nr:SsrA-binding protein [Helicobacter pylori]